MENKYSVVDIEDGDDDVSTSEYSNHLDFAAGSNRPHSYDALTTITAAETAIPFRAKKGIITFSC